MCLPAVGPFSVQWSKWALRAAGPVPAALPLLHLGPGHCIGTAEPGVQMEATDARPEPKGAQPSQPLSFVVRVGLGPSAPSAGGLQSSSHPEEREVAQKEEGPLPTSLFPGGPLSHCSQESMALCSVKMESWRKMWSLGWQESQPSHFLAVT